MTREEFSGHIIAMQDTLYRVSYGMLLNRQDVDDAVQECILKAWRSREKLRDVRYIQTWVIRILINECYALMRSRRSTVSLDSVQQIEAPTDTSNEDLYEAIAALPDKLRLPVILHYTEGYKEAEIAGMLKCPLGTVKTRLRKARALLKESLRLDGRLCYERS